MLFLPNLGSGPKALDARGKVKSGIGERGHESSSEGGWWGGRGDQGATSFRNRRESFWDGGGGGDYNGVVIRRGAGEGSERGVWESGIPFDVEESAVQPSHDGFGLPVRPGEEAIAKGQLEPPHVPDERVESRREPPVEVAVVFLGRVAD